MNNNVTAATKNCFSQPDIIKQLIYKCNQAFMCLIPSPIKLPGLCDNAKLLLHKDLKKKKSYILTGGISFFYFQ